MNQRTRTVNIEGMQPPKILGILINRDPPISSGYCGNDNCEHVNHIDLRRAQKAADTKANK